MLLESKNRWDLLWAQRTTFVPGFILIAVRRNIGNILDVFLRAAAVCSSEDEINTKPLLSFLPAHRYDSGTLRSACTHCRRKARTRTGVAPRRVWPCACRPGGRRPPSAPGQLPSGICISAAAGGKSRPSLPIWRRNGKEFRQTTRPVVKTQQAQCQDRCLKQTSTQKSIKLTLEVWEPVSLCHFSFFFYIYGKLPRAYFSDGAVAPFH